MNISEDTLQESLDILGLSWEEAFVMPPHQLFNHYWPAYYRLRDQAINASSAENRDELLDQMGDYVNAYTTVCEAFHGGRMNGFVLSTHLMSIARVMREFTHCEECRFFDRLEIDFQMS